jgi:hypothetical protein
MTLMTLADIIQRRVRLSPREAAAVTLAVAREWDRHRALRGPISVPEPGGITLQRDGHVAFLVALPVPGVDDAASLSTLFSQLLGIDESRPASRGAASDGSLVTVGGPTAGGPTTGSAITDSPTTRITTPLAVPESAAPERSVESFRAALSRFGDDDPVLLAAVFDRAAGTMQRSLAQRPLTQRPVATRRHRDVSAPAHVPDRRHVPDAVTELRRDLRELEQQAYEGRPREMSGAQLPVTVTPTAPPRHRLGPSWLAAACAVAVVLGVGIAAVTGRPTLSGKPSRASLSTLSASTSAVGLERASADPRATGQPATAEGRPSPGYIAAPQQGSDATLALTQPAVQTGPPPLARPAVPARARVVTPERRATTVRAAQSPAVFAGGSRTITWMAAAAR